LAAHSFKACRDSSASQPDWTRNAANFLRGSLASQPSDTRPKEKQSWAWTFTGEAPKDERGKYSKIAAGHGDRLEFRLRVLHDVLTEKDHNAGHYNDGYLIEKQRAERIAKRLRELCASGRVLDFEREYKLHMDSIPDEPCRQCAGTGYPARWQRTVRRRMVRFL